MLAGLTFAIFSQALSFGFVNLDDDRYVAHNPMLVGGLSARSVQWAFTANLTYLTETAEYWEPLTLLTRLADYQFFGAAPSGHHLTSILLHLAAGLALFGALRRLTGAYWRSAMVAALFLVHPMHVEPVVWLSARKDVVSGLFYILTLWAYGCYRARPNWQRFAALFLIFLAANMAKPMAVSLPIILLLLDLWPLGQVQLERRGWIMRTVLLGYRKTLFFVMAVGVTVLAYLVQRDIGALGGSDSLPLPWRLGAAAVSCIAYLAKAAVPVDLTLFYPHPGRALSIVQALFSVLALVIVSAAAVLQAKRRPWLFVGWFWFLAVLAPVSGIVQVGDQAMADRYSYLAFIGLFIAVVWQAGEWVVAAKDSRPLQPRRALAAAFACAVLMASTTLAFLQVRTWRSNESVFSHALAVTEGNYLAHFNLGATLWEEGRRHEGWWHLQEAARIRGPFLRSQLAMAEKALARGAWAEAIPRLARITIWTPWDAAIRLKLGDALVRNGEPGKALAQFQEALRYQPSLTEPRERIVTLLAAHGISPPAQP